LHPRRLRYLVCLHFFDESHDVPREAGAFDFLTRLVPTAFSRFLVMFYYSNIFLFTFDLYQTIIAHHHKNKLTCS
jgi:hypothetical protein